MKTSTDSNHIDPLHVRATQQQESNMEVEIAFCTTQSAMEGDRRRRLGEIIQDKDLRTSKSSIPLTTVYKAKRVSSVRSAFFWEPPRARAG